MDNKSEVNRTALVEMSELIERLTTSGRPSLDEKMSKQLKKICRLSDVYVKQAYRLTMLQLERDHAEIRRSAAQIIDELFLRSHCFRELLLPNFQHFMELTLETDLKKPLPPPIRVAKELKKLCTQSVHNWYTKFGDSYKQLALGYNFLKSCKKMDFLNVQAQTLAEARLEEEKRMRKEQRLRNAANAAIEEMNEMTAEIRSCLIEAENCMSLLVPDPDAFDIFEARLANNTYKEQVASSDSHDDLYNSVDNCSTFSSAVPSTQSDNEGNLADTKTQTVRFEASEASEFSKEMSSISETTAVEEAAPLVRGTDSMSTAATETNEDETAVEAKSSCEADSISEHKVMDNFETDAICYSPECDRNQDEMDANNEGTDDSVEDDGSNDDESVDGDADERGTGIRRHGILNHKTRMNITLNTNSFAIQETEDNADLLVTLRDQITLANNKLLPFVKRWLDAFTRVGQDEAHVRAALDLKMDLDAMLKKANKLNIITRVHSKEPRADKSSSEDDDDFEEVSQKEGYEPHIPACLREEYGLSPKKPMYSQPAPVYHSLKHKIQRDLDAEDPTSWAATLKRMKQEIGNCTASTLETAKTEGNEPQPSTSKEDPLIRRNREELLKKAPVIPFSTDLYHWGDEVEAPLMVRNETESSTWYAKLELEDIVDVQALAAMKRRTINFVGKFEPVKWHCRAPLPSGKLCVRMDRHKCPFHGRIIPRDRQGVPNEQSHQDNEKEPAEDEAPKSNGWDDPELQADIFAATGIDLSLKKKKRGKGKGRQKRYANLTDIKSLNKNTARKRLEAKVLSNSAIQRVAESLDDLDAKRHRDKFGNNFNYSCQL